MIKKIFSKLLLIIYLQLFQSCTSIEQYHLTKRTNEIYEIKSKYNTENDLFFFGTLRDDNGHIINNFIMAKIKFASYASHREIKQKHRIIPCKMKDSYKIGKYYDDTTKNILNNKWFESLENLNEIERTCTEIEKYSDINFLRAIIYSNLGDHTHAQKFALRFLNLSDNIYPKMYQLNYIHQDKNEKNIEDNLNNENEQTNISLKAFFQRKEMTKNYLENKILKLNLLENDETLKFEHAKIQTKRLFNKNSNKSVFATFQPVILSNTKNTSLGLSLNISIEKLQTSISPFYYHWMIETGKNFGFSILNDLYNSSEGANQIGLKIHVQKYYNRIYYHKFLKKLKIDSKVEGYLYLFGIVSILNFKNSSWNFTVNGNGVLNQFKNNNFNKVNNNLFFPLISMYPSYNLDGIFYNTSIIGGIIDNSIQIGMSYNQTLRGTFNFTDRSLNFSMFGMFF